jgi:hypothetical protein
LIPHETHQSIPPPTSKSSISHLSFAQKQWWRKTKSKLGEGRRGNMGAVVETGVVIATIP